MTTRKITTSALIIGIGLGAVGTEGYNLYRRSHDSQIFQQRLRCKAVADAYVKEKNTDQELVIVTLGKVDYSPARNSCVAELESGFTRAPLLTGYVQDLLSGETLFSARCNEDCEIENLTFINPAFDYVLNHPSKPLELQKSSDLVESHLMELRQPPKSAPGSGRSP